MKPERPDPDARRAAMPAGSAAARLAAAAGGGDVPSPCVSICEMSPDTGLCRGCFRTLDEIAAWSVLDAATKRAIVDALPARRTMADRRP
jgi:predicted Fe-S protein YdhL (DUF1289 family)